MPRLTQTATPKQTVEFVVSVPLDLMNALYFTHLAADAEGIEGWPKQVRTEMDPALLAETDFLYTFPKGQPGVMGTMGDRLFAHRETWQDVDSLVRFVRQLPLGIGEWPERPGIQGLAFCSIHSLFDCGDLDISSLEDVRGALRDILQKEGLDAGAVLAVYDRPEELRERMARLIERFYEEHYRHDLPQRLPCMERSVAAHRGSSEPDVIQLARKLTGRQTSCLEDVCPGPYDELIFAPSLDMGPYTSCAEVGKIHGLFYPCESEYADGVPPEEAEQTRRMARVYKALSDEQRLRILHLLRDGEMYAQEIVERTGLNQSVISRHLTFMSAVGLVKSRRQNNMKFFSINPSVSEELRRALELFVPGSAEAAGTPRQGGGS